jgi:CRISPR/Cas system-associated exonuclease Cas4 (RecB family)
MEKVMEVQNSETKPVKLFPISYSRMSTFENCQLQFEYLYVNKSVSDPGNEHTHYGTRVHESLELYGKERDDKHITRETVKFKPLVDRILSANGDKYFEYQMAIDANREPCDWFSPTVWVRSIADVLVVDGKTAYCVDWKSGKPRDNPTQLQMFACMTMLHFPEVEKVKTSFIWLNHDSVSEGTYYRKNFDLIWSGLESRFSKIQEAVELGVFKPKPSRLCKWCAARSVCSYA